LNAGLTVVVIGKKAKRCRFTTASYRKPRGVID